MVKKISLFLILLLLSGCSDDNSTGGDIDDSGNTSYASIGIEMEPTIANDHATIFLIVDDTTSANNDGIYYTTVSNPIRNLILKDEGLHSPSMTPDFSRLIFLKNGKVYYYYPQNDSLIDPGISQTFTKVVALSNYFYLGYYNNEIYLINYNTSFLNQIASGYDISYYTEDTAVFIKPNSLYNYTVNKFAITVIIEDNIIEYTKSIHPIDTILSDKKITNLTLEPVSQRYAFQKTSLYGYEIYTSQVGSSVQNNIVTTSYGSPLMVGINMLLYLGNDHQLYRTDFLGDNHYLFRGADD